MQRSLENYESEPYSGDPKVLVRGTAKRAFTLIFTGRSQAEYDAAETFWLTHYPRVTFTFRDYRFYPARDFSAYITSQFREQGSETSGRFNYSFDIAEI